MHREGDEDFPEGVEEEFPLEVEDAEVDLVVLVVVKQSAVEKEEMKPQYEFKMLTQDLTAEIVHAVKKEVDYCKIIKAMLMATATFHPNCETSSRR